MKLKVQRCFAGLFAIAFMAMMWAVGELALGLVSDAYGVCKFFGWGLAMLVAVAVINITERAWHD